MPNLIDSYRCMPEIDKVAWKPEAGRFPSRLAINSLPLLGRTRRGLKVLAVTTCLTPLLMTAGTIFAGEPPSPQIPDRPATTWVAPDNLMEWYQQQGRQLTERPQIPGIDYQRTVEIQASVVGADTLKSAIVPQRDTSSMRLSSIEGDFVLAKQDFALRSTDRHPQLPEPQVLSPYPGPNEGKQPVSPEEPQKKPAIPPYPGPKVVLEAERAGQPSLDSQSDQVTRLLQQAASGGGQVIFLKDLLPFNPQDPSFKKQVVQIQGQRNLDSDTANRLAATEWYLNNARQSQQAIEAVLDKWEANGIRHVTIPIFNAMYVAGATEDDIEALIQTGAVDRVVDNTPASLALTPLDGRVIDEPTDYAWYFGVTGLKEVQERYGFRGGPGIRVCNFDSGVSLESYLPSIWWSTRAVDEVFRYGLPFDVTLADNWFDPYNSSTFPDDDDSGHGTSTRYAYAAHRYVGVAPEAQVADIKFLRGDGGETLASFLLSLDWTAKPWRPGQTPEQGDPDKGCDITNHSWGTLPYDGYGVSWWRRICPAFDRITDVMVVAAAAGNKVGQTPAIPAACEGVISVSAHGPDMVVPNIVPSREVDFFAPGFEMSVPVPICYYGQRLCSPTNWLKNAGTSYASPFVVATLVLLESAFPDLTFADHIETMKRTSTNPLTLASTGALSQVGGINILAAVEDERSISRINYDGPKPYRVYLPTITPITTEAVESLIYGYRNRR